MDVDRIEKRVVLPVARERVWRAITDSVEFGSWFGAAFDGPFVAGEPVSGRIEPTRADPEVARLQEPHRGAPMRLVIDRVEPMRLFSFRWHPFAVDPTQDDGAEPMTLVTFELSEQGDGTLLVITESGFEALPPERRTSARTANEGGWEHQARLIAGYLSAKEG